MNKSGQNIITNFASQVDSRLGTKFGPKNTSKFFSKYYWQSILILTQAAIFRQHKNSFLGSFWGVIQPFVHIMIISYVFSFLLKQPTESLVKNLVASLPLWTFIMNSATSSTKSLIERASILRRVYISKPILPITDILVHCYTLSYSLFAMYLAFIIIYPSNFSFTIFLTPIVILPLIVASMAVAIGLAYLTPYIMDIPQIITVVLNAIYWAMPIIYPYSMIPENKRWLFEINPLFHLIRPMQILVIDGSMPSMLIMTKATISALLFVAVSYLIAKKFSRDVIYYL